MSQLIICIFIYLLPATTTPDLYKIRSEYQQAIEDEGKAKQLFKWLDQKESLNPIYKAYKGACYTLLAKHASFPSTKLNYLKQGLQTLNEVIHANPNLTEARYLRYTIEINVPAFLSLSEHVKQDEIFLKNVLTKKTHGVDADMFEKIRLFLLAHAQLSATEKEIFSKMRF